MKDFDTWNEKKKGVDARIPDENFFCNVREVWWCALGVNIGGEQDGKGDESSRPVLVLRVFANNTCAVVPLTTSTRKNPYYFPLGAVDSEQSFAIVSQVKTIDKRRLKQKIATVERGIFRAVVERIKNVLFPNG